MSRAALSGHSYPAVHKAFRISSGQWFIFCLSVGAQGRNTAWEPVRPVNEPEQLDCFTLQRSDRGSDLSAEPERETTLSRKPVLSHQVHWSFCTSPAPRWCFIKVAAGHKTSCHRLMEENCEVSRFKSLPSSKQRAEASSCLWTRQITPHTRRALSQKTDILRHNVSSVWHLLTATLRGNTP